MNSPDTQNVCLGVTFNNQCIILSTAQHFLSIICRDSALKKKKRTQVKYYL